MVGCIRGKLYVYCLSVKYTVLLLQRHGKHRATINEVCVGFSVPVVSFVRRVVDFLVCVCSMQSTSACSLNDDWCSQESGDDQNERAETRKTSEATCDNKCQRKRAGEVSEEARDTKKIHTWHSC